MVLVTGATGFIGRHLTERLLQEGATVRVVTRDRSRVPLLWAGRVEVITGNLLNQGVREQATQGVSLIYHLAGETRDKAAMRAVNVEAVRALLTTAAEVGVKRIVHLSSVGVIGAEGRGVVTEDTPCRPKSEYERTKFEGEQAVLALAQEGRCSAVVVRPAIVFGEGVTRSRDSFLEWLRAINSGQFMFLGRNAVVNYVYVGDVVEAMRQLADYSATGAEVFLAADPAPMRDFVEAAAQALGVPMPNKTMPLWLAYTAGACLQLANRVLGTPAPLTLSRVRALSSRCLFSGDKLQTRVGVTLLFGYRQGLLRTVRWYRERGAL